MTDLRSAPVPDLRADDHVRGPDGAPVVLFYGDFACPKCAVAHERLKDAPVRVAFRHFALRAKHPRAVALAQAAEAADVQGAFWELADGLYADQGRLEDPHLWARCEALGLDLERFEQDRRSAAVSDRVRRDVTDALRAGATGTPTVWVAGDDGDLLDTMVTFGIREARRIGPPTDGRARKGSTYEQ
jgi:protein-disulfide isomerase